MELYPCPARQSWESETRLFFCAHPNHHSERNLVSLEICRVCPLRLQPMPSLLRRKPEQVPSTEKSNCLYLGQEMGMRECASCRGKVRLKVFACAHPRHEETTLRDCEHCVDFRPIPFETTTDFHAGEKP